MRLFRKKQAAVYGVMEVGADAIKAIVFEMASEYDRGNPGAVPELPRVLEKFVWDVPIAYSAARLVKKIKESVFIMTEKAGITPEKVVIALGPEIGEYVLQYETLSMGDAPLTQKNIREQYRRLRHEQTDLRRAVIVAPVEVLINGHPLGQEHWQGNKILAASLTAEIKLPTLFLFMTVENGAVFAGIKKGLSGIAIEFIPLVIAEKEALVRDQHIRDAFLIDVGVGATALASIREGRLIHAAFMPYGIGRMAEIAIKKYRQSPHEARNMMRHYGEEGIRNEALTTASAAAADAAAEWKKNFLHTIDTFYPTGPLSSMVFLTGRGARFSEIKAAVAAYDWLGEFSHATVPSLRVLEGATFFGGNTLEGHLQGPEDAGLAALMAYALCHEPIF